jgi:hypothetical protein
MTTPASPPLPSASDDKNLQLTLLTELGANLRARSEAEHLYTAAAVGGFGAVAWGVAALQPERYLSRPCYKRPAGAAVIGISIVAVAIAAKIIREHGQYAKLRKQQAQIVKQLARLPGAEEIIHEDMQSDDAGPGYKWSLAIVIAAALAAIGFCLSLVSP